jgi:O-antigen ligase
LIPMQMLKPDVSRMTADNVIFVFFALTFLLLPTGTAPPLISFSLALAVWLFSGKVFEVKSIVVQAWFWPVIPFLILPWLGLFYSQNLDLGLDYALKTKYWLAVFLSSSLFLNERRIGIVSIALFCGLLAGAVLALIQMTGIMAPIRSGFPGFGIVHTLISMYLIIGILMAAFYFQAARSWKYRLVCLSLILIFLFHLAVLKGRAGYLIFGLLSPLVANHLMFKFSLKIKIAVSIILACSLFASPVTREVINKSYTMLNEQKEKIVKGEFDKEMPRFYIYSQAVKIIKNHPIIGIGTGSITEPTRANGHVVSHPHNNLLYMGASFGVMGMVACLWLFYTMLKQSWHCRQTAMGYFIFSACLVLFLGGLFDTQILNTGTLLFLALSYGILNHLPVRAEK